MVQNSRKPGRPRTDRFWSDHVARLTEEGLGAVAIERLLRGITERSGRDDLPSGRTIRRLRDGHRSRDESERMPFQEFVWPESMEEAGINWEHSPVVMRFLRYRADQLITSTVREVAWLVRIHLVASEIDFHEMVGFAEELVRLEGDDEPVPAFSRRALQHLLVRRTQEDQSNWERDALWDLYFGLVGLRRTSQFPVSMVQVALDQLPPSGLTPAAMTAIVEDWINRMPDATVSATEILGVMRDRQDAREGLDGI